MPPFLGASVNMPAVLDAAPVTWLLSLALSNMAVAPGNISPVLCSVTLPVTENFCAHAFEGHKSIANATMGKRKIVLFIKG